jgi:uridylate kinase
MLSKNDNFAHINTVMRQRMFSKIWAQTEQKVCSAFQSPYFSTNTTFANLVSEIQIRNRHRLRSVTTFNFQPAATYKNITCIG